MVLCKKGKYFKPLSHFSSWPCTLISIYIYLIAIICLSLSVDIFLYMFSIYHVYVDPSFSTERGFMSACLLKEKASLFSSLHRPLLFCASSCRIHQGILFLLSPFLAGIGSGNLIINSTGVKKCPHYKSLNSFILMNTNTIHSVKLS